MAGLIGALRVSLSADTAAFSAGMTKAQRQAAKSSNAIQKSLSGIKAGVAGLAAGVTLGALTAVAAKALDYAASLGELSQQLGISSKDLQTFNYVASQTGITQEAMQKGIGKLNLIMGQAATGSESAIKSFDALGISFKNADGSIKGAIPVFGQIADKYKNAGSEAERAAIKAEFFGAKAGQQLGSALLLGSKGINQLADAAERMGLVLSDEQIQNADATADKLSELKQVLEARIAGVVADNANSIFQLATSMANLAAGIAKFWAQDPARALAIMGGLAGVAVGGRLAGIPGAIGGGALGAGLAYANAPESMGRLRENVIRAKADLVKARGSKLGTPADRERNIKNRIANLNLNVSRLRAAQTGGAGSFAAPTLGSGVTPDFNAGGGSKRKPRDNSKDILRDQFNMNRDEIRGQIDILRAQESLSHDIKQRADLAKQMVELESKAAELEIAFNLSMGDITAEAAEKQRALNATLDGLLNEKILQDEQYDLRQEQLNLARANGDLALEMAQLENSLAQTASERRDTEMRILSLRLEQERQAQRDILDDDRASVEQKTAAGRRLVYLDKMEPGMREGVRRGTMGPLEAYLDSLPTTAAKANEALEAVAAGGINSIVDGLADAATGARSLGDVFKSVTKQIIADLLRIQIQKAIVGGLSRVFGSSFAPGGSNYGSDVGPSVAISALSQGSLSGGRALGGPVLPGRTYKVGERGPEYLTMGAKGYVTPSNDNARGAYFDLRGAVMTQDLLAQMNRIGDVSSYTGAMQGSTGAQTAIARRRARTLP